MPVENRLDMELTGIKTAIGIKIQGPDTARIQDLGAEMQQVLSAMPETSSVYAERVSQGGAASRFQALIMLLYPLSLLPVLLAYVARYAFASVIAFYLVLAFAGAVGAALYWLALESSVATATRHRERIIHDLSANEGPVTSN